jgi:malonate decarboxylase epsilon subunit
MSVAFIFPGQGAQHPGMLHDLLDDPTVDRTLDEVSEALRADVCALDSEEALKSDVSVQVALLAAGVSTARALMARGIEPAAVAGLSVGAFSAAVIAGVLLLRDGVELVQLRAREMEKLFPSGYGLSAIAGLTESQVTRIVQVETSDQVPVFVGNINAPRQIVVAGANAAMVRVLAEARRQGANKAVRLRVPVLSHCPLLKPVASLLANRIAAMSLTSPQLTYVANVDARALRTKERIADDLANNIVHGVRWHDATTVLEELGCRLFLEMPPGHTLTELARQNLPGVGSLPVEVPTLSRTLRFARLEQAHA